MDTQEVVPLLSSELHRPSPVSPNTKALKDSATYTGIKRVSLEDCDV